MTNKIMYSAISILSMAVICFIVAITLEILTNEPFYMLVIKGAAGLSCIGGPLLGWSIVRLGKKK